MSGRAVIFPASAGVHAGITTPFGTYKKAMRRGAAAAAGAGAAAARDSNQGRATAVPNPLSIVRRLIGVFMGTRPAIGVGLLIQFKHSAVARKPERVWTGLQDETGFQIHPVHRVDPVENSSPFYSVRLPFRFWNGSDLTTASTI